MTATEIETATAAAGSRAAAYRPELFLLGNTLETGGGERQFAALAGGLSSTRFSVRLGCLRNSGVFAGGLDDIAEFPPGGSLFGLRAQRTRLALSQHLRNHAVAVAQSFDFYSNMMLIPAARLAGVPVVIGSHRQLGDLMSWPRFWAQCAALRFCDQVVCNSRAAAEYLRTRGRMPARRLSVIPNGLPDTAFAEVSPALTGGSGVARVGMIARMNDPAKNHTAFLRIASRVARRHPQVQFVLVGDGPLRTGLEEQARSLGLGDRILFLGERHDIPSVLSSLDISVLPSISESLSNVIMESMAAGIPVVAARVGGNAELVRDGETGFLAEVKDDSAFVAAIEMLLERDLLRATFGANAKREARSRFGLEGVCRQYEELYVSVLSKKGWPPRSRKK